MLYLTLCLLAPAKTDANLAAPIALKGENDKYPSAKCVRALCDTVCEGFCSHFDNQEQQYSISIRMNFDLFLANAQGTAMTS